MQDIDLQVLDDLIKQCDQAAGKRFQPKPKPPTEQTPPSTK